MILIYYQYHAVTALLKVEILKANHNHLVHGTEMVTAVTALLKVEILKANHNSSISAVISEAL